MTSGLHYENPATNGAPLELFATLKDGADTVQSVVMLLFDFS